MSSRLPSAELVSRLRTALRDLHFGSRVTHDQDVDISGDDGGPDRVIHVRLAPDAAQALLETLDRVHEQDVRPG